jgi:FkbM family methyltransferase
MTMLLALVLVLVIVILLLQNNHMSMQIRAIAKKNLGDIIEIDHARYGNIRMVANDYITNHIGADRIWEPHVVEVLAEHYVPGTDVLDIGCHSGLSMLGMHRLKPITGLAHCIEAQSRQCEIIKHNLEGKIPYRLYNMALTDEPRMLCFDVNRGNTGATVLRTQNTRTCVAGLRLDDLLPFFKNRVSVIKMDVEGHEFHVVNGARKFLERDRPVIEIEINSGGSEHFSKMTKLFEELGYKMTKNMKNEDYVFVPVDK